MKKNLIAVLLLILSLSIMGCSASSGAASSNSRDAASGSGSKTTAPEASANSKEMQASLSDNDNGAAENNDAAANKAESSAMDSVDKELDVAVGNAVIDSNNGSFLEGEVKAEGHIILQQGTGSDDSIVIYALTMYGEYGFQNDAFIKISGTGAIPTVITFAYDEDTGYALRSYSVPNDGSGYVDSVKEMFPKDLYNYVLSVSDSDLSSLQAKERKYAKAYLNQIGRSAVIGDYADIKYEFPQISDEASNEIFKRYSDYPDWIGTEERIEDGVRYVYETQWKNYGNDDSMIYFTKYVYGTGEIIKTVNVFIEDGVVQSSEEKVTRIIENSAASNSYSK
ncbi:MAG: hypothetical protein VB119_05515 [Candidatus Metalachnospira sp.]|nr:hypothetical protein [Candidatus Metalachnospira sp.]